MKLDVGMYVRTRKGKISKIIRGKQIFPSPNVYTFCWELDDKTLISMNTSKIVKYSHNIIDLIEVGDYVNGREVKVTLPKTEYAEQCIMLKGDSDYYYDIHIKSIVTKEQFESMSYKI